MESLMDDAKGWLAEHSYGVHHYSPDGKNITFCCSDTELEHYSSFPAIKVWVNETGERRCQLHYSGLKMFLTLSSGEIQYRHPDIIKYITVMVNYVRVMESINPFRYGS